MTAYQALINNKYINSQKVITTNHPFTDKPLLTVPALTKQDIDSAFKAASDAFLLWRNTSLNEKINHISKLIESLKKNKEEFVFLLMNEILKNKKDSESEFDRTIEIIQYSIEEMKRIQGELLTGDGWGINNKLGIFTREPLGVTLAIAPFNYPLNLAMTKIIPAILTGNTVVFKPASFSSGVGCLIGKSFEESGFPAGVLNVVTGKGSEIGDYLVANDEIKLINFTGSSSVGKHLCQISKMTNKILELGGKDAALVLDDANLEETASSIIKGAFSFSGQRCTAIKRVFVSKETGKKLVPLIVEKINKLTVGMPEDNAFITPVVDKHAAEDAMKMITEAKNDGAKILTGGKQNKNLIYPTLIDDVDIKSDIAWKEPFAPVLPIIYCENIEKMIELNNQSEYGLQASIFTQNINLAFDIAKRLEVGSVNINEESKRSPDHFPFLGVKDSGLGVQGIKETLIAYTRPKGIIVNYK